jgi:hypothetical protein
VIVGVRARFTQRPPLGYSIALGCALAIALAAWVLVAGHHSWSTPQADAAHSVPVRFKFEGVRYERPAIAFATHASFVAFFLCLAAALAVMWRHRDILESQPVATTPRVGPVSTLEWVGLVTLLPIAVALPGGLAVFAFVREVSALAGAIAALPFLITTAALLHIQLRSSRARSPLPVRASALYLVALTVEAVSLLIISRLFA